MKLKLFFKGYVNTRCLSIVYVLS